MFDCTPQGLVRIWLPLALAVSAPAFGNIDDPTRPARLMPAPAGVDARAPATWSLGSTLVSGSRRFAVINGRLVGVGAWVNGARVVRIEEQLVVLQRDDGDSIELEFTPVRSDGR